VAADHYVPLTVSRLSSDGVTVLRLEGELDLAAAPQLRAELDEVTDDSGTSSLTLDLAGVSFIDSTGLQELLVALRRLRDRGGTLVLTNPRPIAMRLFEITGLIGVFDIRTADRDGLRSIQAPAS
jgi:anti-sigma B factor antagonist